MSDESGIVLARDGQVLAETAVAVNDYLSKEGIRVWPLDLGGIPAEIRRSLDQPSLSDVQATRVLDHFLLPRERLLRVIAEAGRHPNHPEGGSLSTYCVDTKISYPQLHVISRELDYSGFFPLHVNVGEDGSGSDEIGQVLSGRNMVYRYRLSSGAIVTLSLSCPRPERGWLFTFSGVTPHGGMLAETDPGTKVLVQAIGPSRFHRRYVD